MALNFSDDETYRLIRLYRSHESLYDRDHLEYSSRAVRRRIIGEIADALGKPSTAIMAKIECLRTQFALSLKKQRASEKEGTAQPKVWRFFHPLLFLDRHMTKQPLQDTGFRSGKDEVDSVDSADRFHDQDQNGERQEYYNEGYNIEEENQPMPEHQKMFTNTTLVNEPYSDHSYDGSDAQDPTMEHQQDPQQMFSHEPSNTNEEIVNEYYVPPAKFPTKRARKRKPEREPQHDDEQTLYQQAQQAFTQATKNANEGNVEEYYQPVHVSKRRATVQKRGQERAPKHGDGEPPMAYGHARNPREDDCDAFGQLVAAELRNMGAAQRLVTKREIMSVVYGYMPCEVKAEEVVVD